MFSHPCNMRAIRPSLFIFIILASLRCKSDYRSVPVYYDPEQNCKPISGKADRYPKICDFVTL